MRSPTPILLSLFMVALLSTSEASGNALESCIRGFRSFFLGHYSSDVPRNDADRTRVSQISISGADTPVARGNSNKYFQHAELANNGGSIRVVFKKPHFSASLAEAAVTHASQFGTGGGYGRWSKVTRKETETSITYTFKIRSSWNEPLPDGKYIDYSMTGALEDVLKVLDKK